MQQREDIDELMAELADLATPLPVEVPFPHRMTRTQEEEIHGVRVPSKRGGRIAIFYRDEVEAIRKDKRPIMEIAEAWDVSFDTIQRVRQAGRFKDVPYIPRDEVDRRVSYLTGLPVQPTMSEFPVSRGGKKGRPFKSGREDALTEDERSLIASDKRRAHVVAAEYNVSPNYVNKIRREAGVSVPHRGPLTQATMDAIKADGRPYADIAIAFRVPALLVKKLKETVTPAGNNGGNHAAEANTG